MSRSTTPTQTEECRQCGRETPHAVQIEMVTESESGDTVGFSREPYRVSRCQICGDEQSQRMNHV